MPTRRLCGFAVAFALLICGRAAASSVQVNLDESGFSTGNIVYVAAPGERNQLTVDSQQGEGQPDRATITDPGAVIEPSSTDAAVCASADAHTVVCRGASGVRGDPFHNDVAFHRLRARLGDLDDALSPPRGFISVIAAGGPGNDTLAGGRLEDRLTGGAGNDTLAGGELPDRLTGGAGNDVLRGGAGDDVLVDDGPANEGDVLDGGSSTGLGDTVSYRGHGEGVSVRLDRGGDDPAAGSPGEGDQLAGIAIVRGGGGDDRLEGGDGLAGRGGDDVLIADSVRHGLLHSMLVGGPGDDVLRGNARNDSLFGGQGRDTFRCARGRDVVQEPERDELLGADCETLRISRELPSEAVKDLRFAPVPREVTATSATFGLRCLEPGPPDCRGKIVLRDARGSHRLLGRARFAGRTKRRAFRVVVELTRRGRRLARRHPRAVVRAKVREGFGGFVFRARWSLRLNEG